MAKGKYINTTKGPRGGYLDGKLVMVPAGGEAELDDASDAWFAKAGSKDAKAAKADEADDKKS